MRIDVTEPRVGIPAVRQAVIADIQQGRGDTAGDAGQAAGRDRRRTERFVERRAQVPHPRRRIAKPQAVDTAAIGADDIVLFGLIAAIDFALPKPRRRSTETAGDAVTLRIACGVGVALPVHRRVDEGVELRRDVEAGALRDGVDRAVAAGGQRGVIVEGGVHHARGQAEEGAAEPLFGSQRAGELIEPVGIDLRRHRRWRHLCARGRRQRRTGRRESAAAEYVGLPGVIAVETERQIARRQIGLGETGFGIERCLMIDARRVVVLQIRQPVDAGLMDAVIQHGSEAGNDPFAPAGDPAGFGLIDVSVVDRAGEQSRREQPAANRHGHRIARRLGRHIGCPALANRTYRQNGHRRGRADGAPQNPSQPPPHVSARSTIAGMVLL